MIPEWMSRKDNYIPEKDNTRYVFSTIKVISNALAKIRIQKGHEKQRHLPALVKLFMTIIGVVINSVTQNHLVTMAYAAVILLYLCTWPAIDIWNIFKSGIIAVIVSLLILLPSMVVNIDLRDNNLYIIIKVFFGVVTVSIFNHTTQWNHITGALKKCHVPGVFIFILDITLKYIVLLGNFINDLLTALTKRMVGKNHRKYNTVGSVLGVTFVRGCNVSRQMYEAMQCREFTDDYKGL